MRDLPANAKIILTRDGSPTLSWTKPGVGSEEMHHSGGALSESLFIYDEALHEVLRREWPVVVTSVGLGLAYNELIAIGRLYSRQDWKIVSYEAEAFLREEFSDWLRQPLATDSIFTDVLHLVAAHLNLAPENLKRAADFAQSNGQLQLRGAFPTCSTPNHDCTCVFYDAFSQKMNAELWTEENLKFSLQSIIADRAVFATYAATGALNRALTFLGFRLLPKEGFCGKRQSTLAIRE